MTSSNTSEDTSNTSTDDTTSEDVEEESKTATTGWKFSGETQTYQAYHPDQWTTPKEVLFSELSITETDLRVKTSEFVSPYDIDLTQGRVCCWIQRKYGENFGGIILSKELQKETGMFIYTCQDWNRLLNNKVNVILAGDMKVYDIIKILLVKMGLSTDGLKPIEYYDNTLFEVPDDDDPWESLQNTDSEKPANATGVETGNNDSDGDIDDESTKKNVFRLKPEGYYDKLTALDFIRALVLKQGSLIEFYMDENGVPRFEKYEKESWLKKRWYLVDTDVYDVRLKNDITDQVTQVAVKRVDELNPDATLYTSEKVLGVNLAKFYGVMGDVIDNPVKPTSGSSTPSGDVITVTGKPSCGHCKGKSPYRDVTRSYKNECPFCGKHNLQDTPKDPSRKRIPEGEITCGSGASNGANDGCDADFCINCGHEKMTRDAAQLTPVGASFDGGNTNGGVATVTSSGTRARRTGGASTNSTSSDSSDETEDIEDTGDGSTIAVEDPKKNLQAVRITMSENLRKMFTFSFKMPGEFPNLHTNTFVMLMMSNHFMMENLPAIGKGLNGKFTRYAGFEKNRFYVEEVVFEVQPDSAPYTQIKANPFPSDYSTYAKTQMKAEQALASLLNQGSAGNANGTDCNDDTGRTNKISIGYGGSATSQTPTSKALAVIGNSSSNYSAIAKKANGNPAKALKIVHRKHTYLGYSDNERGKKGCPQQLYSDMQKGNFLANCGDCAWFMKCIFDCMGLQNYILHGSPCGTGHYWNCVKYQGRWIMGDICYWGRPHNELSRM